MEQEYFYHAAFMFGGKSIGRIAIKTNRILDPSEYIEYGAPNRIIKGPFNTAKEAEKGKAINAI